jgi:hypothetical protein
MRKINVIRIEPPREEAEQFDFNFICQRKYNHLTSPLSTWKI